MFVVERDEQRNDVPSRSALIVTRDRSPDQLNTFRPSIARSIRPRNRQEPMTRIIQALRKASIRTRPRSVVGGCLFERLAEQTRRLVALPLPRPNS